MRTRRRLVDDIVTCWVITEEQVSGDTKSTVVTGVLCASSWVGGKQGSRVSLLEERSERTDTDRKKEGLSRTPKSAE
jgi:hypothetical protein